MEVGNSQSLSKVVLKCSHAMVSQSWLHTGTFSGVHFPECHFQKSFLSVEVIFLYLPFAVCFTVSSISSIFSGAIFVSGDLIYSRKIHYYTGVLMLCLC